MALKTILEETALDGFAPVSEFGGLFAFIFSGVVDNLGLKAGANYVVEWNSVKYDVVGVDGSSMAEGAVGIGNGSIFGVPGTEPFAIVELPGMLYIICTDPECTETAHTLAIYEETASATIIVKDRNGNDVTHEGVNGIRVRTEDGSSKIFVDPDTVSGSGESRRAEDKPIKFYDPWGNVIYGYTRAEIQELDALPPGPALSGLVFQGWNISLSSLKSQPYFADVGPYYKRSTGESVNVMIIETLQANQTVNLNFYGRLNTMVIDWGDGSEMTTATVSTGSSYGAYSYSHKYVTAGEYIISVSMSGTYGCTQGYNGSSTFTNVLGNAISSSSNGNHSDTNILLISFIGSAVYNSGFYLLTPESFNGMWRLRFVSLYGTLTCDSRTFMNCTSLKTIAGSGLGQIYVKSLRCAASLERLYLTNALAADALTGCYGMKEIRFGSGSISDPNMNSKWAMLMTTTTPPTISATNPVWGTYPIYVPDSAVDTYKTATGWSNAADYIKPQSEYPD